MNFPMRFLLFTMILMLSSNSNVHSQNKTIGITNYLNTYNHAKLINFQNSNNSRLLVIQRTNQLISFSPAITFYTKKGSFLELEFSKFLRSSETLLHGELNDPDLFFDTIDARYRFGTSFFVLRLEYNFRLVENIEGTNVKLNLGTAIKPYFLRMQHNPLNSSHRTVTQTISGFDIQLVPRLSYSVHPNIIIDLNLPVSFAKREKDKTTIAYGEDMVEGQTEQSRVNRFIILASGLRLGCRVHFSRCK